MIVPFEKLATQKSVILISKIDPLFTAIGIIRVQITDCKLNHEIREIMFNISFDYFYYKNKNLQIKTVDIKKPSLINEGLYD